MKLNKIFFSPTDATKKILDGITKGIEAKIVKEFNLDEINEDFFHEIKSGITLFGVPIDDGKISDDLIKKIDQFSADKQICIIVITYCKKNYKTQLTELKTLVMNNGFIPIATAAFIGNRTFTDLDLSEPHSKPDDADINACYNFGKKIRAKLGSDKDIINSVIEKSIKKSVQ